MLYTSYMLKSRETGETIIPFIDIVVDGDLQRFSVGDGHVSESLKETHYNRLIFTLGDTKWKYGEKVSISNSLYSFDKVELKQAMSVDYGNTLIVYTTIDSLARINNYLTNMGYQENYNEIPFILTSNYLLQAPIFIMNIYNGTKMVCRKHISSFVDRLDFYSDSRLEDKSIVRTEKGLREANCRMNIQISLGHFKEDSGIILTELRDQPLYMSSDNENADVVMNEEVWNNILNALSPYQLYIRTNSRL